MIVFTLMYLGLASVWDLKEKKIPLWVLVSGGVAEVMLALLYGLHSGDVELARLITGMIPGLLLLVLSLTGQQVGPADGMILCAVGAAESYAFALQMLMWACLITGGVSVIGLLFRCLRKEDRLPFVPFLTAGYVVSACLQWSGL